MERTGLQWSWTGIASGDLSGSIHRFVVATGRDVHLAAASGTVVRGVLNSKPEDDEAARVVNLGHTKITLGESLGANAIVMTNDSGYAIAASSGQARLGYLIGGADSGGVGEMFFTFTGTGD